MHAKKCLVVFGFAVLAALTGCTSVTVDQMRWQESTIDPTQDSVVVLGRHHSPEFETEPSLISCIGRKLSNDIDGLNVIDAEEFRDAFYPWFEPRTAPLNMDRFIQVLDEPLIAEEMEERNIRYMIWIEGSTETLNQAGSISCALSPAGGGCFGFGTWENESNYEASIWDFRTEQEVGRISTDAKGTSYMPAVVIPLPILARVQSNACSGMGGQISSFLQPVESS